MVKLDLELCFDFQNLFNLIVIKNTRQSFTSQSSTRPRMNIFVSKTDYVIDPPKAVLNTTVNRFEPNVPLSEIEFDEGLLWRAIQTHSVLLSGKAGAGKSTVLKKFIRHSENAKYNVVVTAPTGIASRNINGKTIYHALGLGLAKESAEQLWAKIQSGIKRGFYHTTWSFLTTTNILVIDEISMVKADLFNKLDFLFRKARKCPDPFGGIRLLMVGDFAQLGPVNKNDDSDESSLVIDSPVWLQLPLVRICLRRTFRQAEGDPFITLLNNVRKGNMSEQDYELLKTRFVDPSVSIEDRCRVPGVLYPRDVQDLALENKSPPADAIFGTDPMDLYPKLIPCNNYNFEKIYACHQRKLDVKVCEPLTKIGIREAQRGSAPVRHMDKEEVKRADAMMKSEEMMEKEFPVLNLSVCKGAQVMMRINKFRDIGLDNGTMGIVLDFDENIVECVFITETHGMVKVKLMRHQFRHPIGHSVDVIVEQFPITLAWACSQHKCQGLTLPIVRVDAKSCFAPGMLYTALSRVRRIEDLFIIGFNHQSLISHPRCTEFESIVDEFPVTFPDKDKDATDKTKGIKRSADELEWLDPAGEKKARIEVIST